MRIAILHYTAAPVIGGVERVIADQARALRMLGHEVAVLTRPEVRALSEPFDAVLVHNVFTMPFDLTWTRDLHDLARSAQGVRWINWVHDVASVNPYYAHLPWHEAGHALLNEPPACIHVAVSETRRRDYARATGLPLEKIRVIPNGIDLPAVLGLTERVTALQLWRHDLILFHPTRLIRRKNIELGIRVLAELQGRGLRAVYAVTGAPDPHQDDGLRYFEKLKTLAQECGVSARTLFLGEGGALSDDDVRGLYAMADCLFFPSKAEGFGLPLVEAGVHRLPVFCSDLPVHREVIGEGGGFFSPDAAPADIAAQIQSWFSASPEIHGRRELWRHYDMIKICQERLEPLLRIA